MISSAAQPDSPEPLAVLAHELRTPLAAIVGMADAMAAEILGPLPAAYADYARLIREAGLHTLEVLAALGEASPGTGEPREEAGQVVRNVTDAIRLGLADRRIQLDLELAQPASGAMIPGRVLRQILFNLLNNAQHHTGAGGRIVVRLCVDEGRLRLDVADTGRGAGRPPAGLSPSRAGLGLAIVRTLCAVHGGAFEIATAPAGATARAWLEAAVTE